MRTTAAPRDPSRWRSGASTRRERRALPRTRACQDFASRVTNALPPHRLRRSPFHSGLRPVEPPRRPAERTAALRVGADSTPCGQSGGSHTS
eukprot:7385943-Prymnesium_polylepis.2